jgi:hypothetical protein
LEMWGNPSRKGMTLFLVEIGNIYKLNLLIFSCSGVNQEQ